MTTRARDPGALGREIEHTADLGVEVDGPTLAAVFERAGLAMLALAMELAPLEPRERIALAVEGADLAELLHDFLQTLLVRLQTDGFAACELDVEHLDEHVLRATAAGERIDPLRHPLHTEIKGVTYHQLAVQRTDAGWTARVIFDV